MNKQQQKLLLHDIQTDTGLPLDDLVNHPKHYTQNGIVCIDGIASSMPVDQFYGYLKGNIIKYLWRYDQKLKGNPVQDLNKARWYLDRLIKVFECQEEKTSK